jgi:hypothetical protein
MERFWPLPGEYLQKSTLQALARNISGLELPPPLIKETTFESSKITQDEEDICYLPHNFAERLLKVLTSTKRKRAMKRTIKIMIIPIME